MPFVVYKQSILIKDNIRNILDELCRRRRTETDDENAIDLEREVVHFDENEPEQLLELKRITEFYRLLLFYLSINVKMPQKGLRLIDARKFIEWFPDTLLIVCNFTSRFPLDWRQDLENTKYSFILLFSNHHLVRLADSCSNKLLLLRTLLF